MTLADRDVGEMAEGLLRTWAGQGGFVANRVEVDKTGWDFLVEFKRPGASADPPRSLDHEPPASAALVQVKGTDAATSVDIKLDSMKRMIDWPIPTFVFVAVYKGADDPTTTYLVPVDEDLVRRTLERLRKVPDDDQGRLHEMTLTISWEDRHRLPANNGRAFRDAIQAHVGADPARYAAQKMKWKKTLGYGERPISARLVFKEKDPNEVQRQMVSFALGMVDRLNASLADVSETRFGITKPVQWEERDTYLQIKPLPIAGKATIAIRSKKKSSAVNLECTYYDPRILFPGIEEKNLRFRFVSGFVDLILHFDTRQWDFSFDFPEQDELVSLESIAQAVDVFFMLQGAAEDELDLGLALNDGEMERAGFDPRTLQMNRTLDSKTRTGYEAASDAYKIAQYVDLGRSVRVRIEQLVEASEPLRACRLLIDPAMYPYFEMKGTIPGAPTGRLGYPTVAGGQIGNSVVVVGAVVGGRPEYTGETTEEGARFEIKMPSVHVVVKEVIPVKANGLIATAPYFQRLRAWMAENGMDILPVAESMPQ